MGYVAYLGHVAVETRRPCEAQGIVAGRYEVAFVFEGMKCGFEIAKTGDNFAIAIDSVAALHLMSEESNKHRQK